MIFFTNYLTDVRINLSRTFLYFSNVFFRFNWSLYSPCFIGCCETHLPSLAPLIITTSTSYSQNSPLTSHDYPQSSITLVKIHLILFIMFGPIIPSALLAPFAGQLFDSLEDAQSFYCEYASKSEFNVWSTWMVKVDNHLRKKIFVYPKEGFSMEKK